MKILILSRFLQPRASPQNSLWGSTYSFFFGSTTSGKTVNERTAMQTTAVYACVRILAETIASLPLHVYRYTVTAFKKNKGCERHDGSFMAWKPYKSIITLKRV